MLKQVQHEAVLDSLNDLGLPTSVLKPLTPAFFTTHNLHLATDPLLLPTRNHQPPTSSFILATWNLRLATDPLLLQTRNHQPPTSLATPTNQGLPRFQHLLFIVVWQNFGQVRDDSD